MQSSIQAMKPNVCCRPLLQYKKSVIINALLLYPFKKKRLLTVALVI